MRSDFQIVIEVVVQCPDHGADSLQEGRFSWIDASLTRISHGQAFSFCARGRIPEVLRIIHTECFRDFSNAQPSIRSNVQRCIISQFHTFILLCGQASGLSYVPCVVAVSLGCNLNVFEFIGKLAPAG